MALASWLRGVRIPKGDTKPGKVQHFGANFEGTLFLESGILRPYGKIRGRLCIETRFMLKFTGIHVQLEAELYLKFSSQNGRHCYRKRTCILENTLTLKSGDQLSPYRIDLVPPVPEGKDLIVVILPESSPTPTSPSYTCASQENFIFTLPCPSDSSLPAPFKSPYGSLSYRLVAYMRSIYGRYVQIAEKTLQFPGHLNLYTLPGPEQPLRVKRALLDISCNVQATLSLLQGPCYLPQEPVPFQMFVRNPGCIPLQICVFIAQKVTYNVDGTKLCTCSRVDQVELFEGAPESDTLWKGSLVIPKDQPCSYHDKDPSYDVRYAIQFKVHVENHGTIRGTGQLIIGTTRDSPEVLKSQANTLQVPGGSGGVGGSTQFLGLGERRGSNSSIRSEHSYRGGSAGGGGRDGGGHKKKQSLPSYSQVNSPVRSVDNLSLAAGGPPGYLLDMEELDDLEEISIPVPSTSSSQRGSIAEELE